MCLRLLHWQNVWRKDETNATSGFQCTFDSFGVSHVNTLQKINSFSQYLLKCLLPFISNCIVDIGRIIVNEVCFMLTLRSHFWLNPLNMRNSQFENWDWQICQSQANPQGQFSIYIIKWRLDSIKFINFDEIYRRGPTLVCPNILPALYILLAFSAINCLLHHWISQQLCIVRRVLAEVEHSLHWTD